MSGNLTSGAFLYTTLIKISWTKLTEESPYAAHLWSLVVVCGVGTFRNGSTCELCPQGTYQNLQEQTRCVQCPPGSNNHGPGLASPGQCFLDKGRYFYLTYLTTSKYYNCTVVTMKIAMKMITALITLILADSNSLFQANLKGLNFLWNYLPFCKRLSHTILVFTSKYFIWYNEYTYNHSYLFSLFST